MAKSRARSAARMAWELRDMLLLLLPPPAKEDEVSLRRRGRAVSAVRKQEGEMWRIVSLG